MMNKDEFLSFLTKALDDAVEQKQNGYAKADFSSFETGEGTEEPYEDYPEEEEFEEEYDEEDEEPIKSSTPLNFSSSEGGQRKAFDLSNDFTQDLFSSLINKFKPSDEVRNAVFNTKQSFEDIPTESDTIQFCGKPMKYVRYEKPLELPEDLVLNTNGSLEESLNSYNDLLECIMNEVERVYLGRDRIESIAVVSEIVIINGVAFEPLLKDSLIESLPYDLQYAVRNGCFAYLFDFSCLYRYKNITSLKFDSVDFLYQKVRIDLGKGNDFEPKDLFRVCKKLDTLNLGEYVITRRNVNEHRDVFRVVKRSTEIADKLEDLGWTGTKKGWNCMKDIFMSKDTRAVWKVLKLAVVGSVTTAAAVGTSAFKIARVAGAVGSTIKKSVQNLSDAIRENS